MLKLLRLRLKLRFVMLSKFSMTICALWVSATLNCIGFNAALAASVRRVDER